MRTIENLTKEEALLKAEEINAAGGSATAVYDRMATYKPGGRRSNYLHKGVLSYPHSKRNWYVLVKRGKPRAKKTS